MNDRRLPKLRFKGFKDDWEQRKLGDVLRTLPFKQFLKTPEQGGKYEIIQQGNEPIIGYANGEPCESFRNTVIFGDHTLSLYKPKKPFFVATDGVRILQGTNDMDGYYLLSLLEGNSLKSEGYKRYYSILLDREVLLTENHCEQVQIGLCFKHFDHLITLHQRKLEKLKIVKKAMLENCFPKNGEKVPRFRFSGFTGDWEQRKLGEIGKARSGVGFPDAEQGGRTGVPFFKVSDMNLDVNENEMTISNNYVTAEQIANHRWSPITELPAIFFAKVGAAVLLNRKRLCRFPFLLDNNTMSYSLSPTKWDADFAKALFGTVDLTSLVQVGALPSYNAGDVESMEKYLPSLLEQEQIGVFFKRLDHLITLHQRKLEKLKIIKKSFLEKMFV